MRALLLTLTLACLTLPTRARADSLRCGNELASEGSTTVEVELKCGAPTSRNVRTQVFNQATQSTTSARDGQTTRNTQRQAVSITIEEWIYNPGPNRLIQIAVFENGRLLQTTNLGEVRQRAAIGDEWARAL